VSKEAKKYWWSDLLIKKNQNRASTISKLNKSETHHELVCRFGWISFQGLERIVQLYRTLSFLLSSEGVAENILYSSCQQARSQNDRQHWQATVACEKTTWWKKRAIVVVVLNAPRRALFKRLPSVIRLHLEF